MNVKPVANQSVNHGMGAGATDSDSPSKLGLDAGTTRTVIFILLFGVTGFLGLPLLWFSKSFTPAEKLLWSVINVVYTLTLIGLTALICWWSYTQIQQAIGF